MDIVANHTSKILGFKTDYVNKVYSISNRMSYGEDISDCCARKLFLASQLINRLDCYCFPVEKVDSVFTISITNIYPIGRDPIFEITVNGVLKASALYSDYGSAYAIHNYLFTAAGLTYTVSSQPFGAYDYVVYAACDVTSIQIYYPDTDEILTNTVVGSCESITCYNCWKDSDLPKLYELVSKLIK